MGHFELKLGKFCKKKIFSNPNYYCILLFEFLPISGLCLLEKESEYKSQAIGHHNGAQHLGIFQISDRWWCKWDREYNIGCGVKCHNFLDEDLKDDMECAKKIFKEHSRLHGNGFNAW